MASISKTSAVLLISMMILMAHMQVGEAIRWQLDQTCYSKCNKDCMADGSSSASECKDACEPLCDSLECVLCVKVGNIQL
ncbi:hypothetical protein I3760_11G165100 [Carya illinoinensis]|nr:hypothetical protein I3760_11G165100 [Carya illinoinensis]